MYFLLNTQTDFGKCSIINSLADGESPFLHVPKQITLLLITGLAVVFKDISEANKSVVSVVNCVTN